MQISPSDPERPAERVPGGCSDPSKPEAHCDAGIRPGCDVRVRGARWRVADVRALETCRVITLTGLAPPHVGVERRILEPFDIVEPIDRARRPRVVRARRWRRACRGLIAADVPPGSLRAARAARIELMPYQLEPAMAVLGGLGVRVLLADEVGLGKTIQAGLVVAELLARGWIDRVLVLAPAGLRGQWAEELMARFDIDAASVDGHVLRRLATALPIGVNPWSTVPIAIASTDYVKRADVLPAVASCPWDLVIVDEAHGVGGDSDRHDAVQRIASRASYVLLLTATPHSGDPKTFASLCGLGATNADGLVFRRSRAHLRPSAERRVHTLRVRSNDHELRMHAALARYTAAVCAEHGNAWLALSVLHKRAFSSAWALLRSVERRIADLSDVASSFDAAQIALPLGDPYGEFTSDDEPPAWPDELALSDSKREQRLLTALANACTVAACDESKVAALVRLLRRARESAVVFTEYRDTLVHLQHALAGFPVLVLHGGLARDERAAALRAFSRGSRAILLATDAAGEGLNLHQACRLVINLELPWNPMRLEQRIGRVDRIGQRRTVHAFHLVARDTGEGSILDRLKSRITRAQIELGAPDPIGLDDERSLAQLVITGRTKEQPGTPTTLESVSLVTPDLGAAAVAEAERLRFARTLSKDGDEALLVRLEGEGPWIATALRRRLRAALGSDALMLWRLALENESGRVLESQLVAIRLTGLGRHKCLVPSIEASSLDWRDRARRTIDAFLSARLSRERAMLAVRREGGATMFQPGLFDRRAERTRQIQAVIAADSGDQIVERMHAAEHAGRLTFRPPELLLALLP